MILVITGPTGVGKTKLSIELAKKYNAIIVNCDATQIYQELNIGSAKVTEEEKEGINHYLLDIKKPNEDYSVCNYQNDLRNILDNNKDKNIIIVGGTGLYITAGLYDYEFSKYDDIDLSNYSNEELYNMCLNIDNTCDIHVNNRIRLENFIKRNGKVLKEPRLLYDAIFIGLTTDRNNLYNIINNRVDKMINDGLIDEVKDLYSKYKDSNILKRAIGYKELISYLNNEISKDEAVDLIKKNSRHYAKRQYTWFNNKMNIKWFTTNYNNFNETINDVVNYIDNLSKK